MGPFIEAFLSREVGSEDYRRGFQAALSYVQVLLQHDLTKLCSEVSYLTMIEAAMQLTNDRGLQALVGKTVIVVNPEEGQLQKFLADYQSPKGSGINVRFQRGRFDGNLQVVMEDVPPPQESAS
jgi:hypothetical protein